MFKKILSVNLFWLMLAVISYGYSDDELNSLEMMKYGQSYEYNSLSERLNRLETDYFGMAQSGDLDSRISKLMQISRSNTVPRMYDYEQPKKRKMKNFWDNVTSVFDTGSITGFTPPMALYGYTPAQENIYRQEYLNFLNNPNGYCPYHQRNTYMNGLNSSPFGVYDTRINQHPYMGHYPIRRYYRPQFYSPPNIYSRAGVHIIND